jgi:hypothetical protein
LKLSEGLNCLWVECLRAARKRPAEGEAQERQGGAQGLDHKAILRGQQWKLQRVQSLSSLPSDESLLARAGNTPGE